MLPHSIIPSGFCQCGCGQQTTIAPRTWNARQITKGQPRRYLTGHANKGKHFLSLEQRLWAHVNVSTEKDACWTWFGAKIKKGYGRIYRENKCGPRVLAHRLSYELAFGAIPDGVLVCHKCDNPSCVRPDHLFLGTHLDNAQDRDRKGRNGSLHGEAAPASKLTVTDVLAIRMACEQRSMKQAEIAKRFGVSKHTVGNIATGRTWRLLE